MKTLITLLFACCFGSAVAQSNLPACPSSVDLLWNNCYGTFTFAIGNRYVGEFKDGKPGGQGTYFHLADNQFKGDKYVGEFKNGERNGQGIYFYLANNKFRGDKYVGEHRFGVPYGQGINFRSDGSVEKSGIYECPTSACVRQIGVLD